MIHAFLWMFLLIQAQTAEPQPPAEAVTLLQSGLDAERAGDLDQAIAAFRKAANLDPSSPVVFLNLGDAYMKKHDYAAAVPPLKHALELSPDSPPVNQLLGFALLAEGYASEAIPRLEIVHEYGALGIAELQAGHPEEAVTNLESALAKDPNNPDLLYYLSRAATALSSQSLDRLLSEFPDTARGHQALGQNYFEMKMFPQAVKEFEQAIAMRPDLPGLRLELG